MMSVVIFDASVGIGCLLKLGRSTETRAFNVTFSRDSAIISFFVSTILFRSSVFGGHQKEEGK